MVIIVDASRVPPRPSKGQRLELFVLNSFFFLRKLPANFEELFDYFWRPLGSQGCHFSILGVFGAPLVSKGAPRPFWHQILCRFWCHFGIILSIVFFGFGLLFSCVREAPNAALVTRRQDALCWNPSCFCMFFARGRREDVGGKDESLYTDSSGVASLSVTPE